MKKMFALVLSLVLMVAFSTTALAECHEDWLVTTMVVADEGWDYNVKVNVRVAPSLKAEKLGTVPGGSLFVVSDCYIDDEGRIWAEIWYETGYAYISTKYLQPLEEGSFFWLSMNIDVLDQPLDDSNVIAEFYENQFILVSEIINNDHGQWCKVMADGRYGYIQLVLLDPIW